MTCQVHHSHHICPRCQMRADCEHVLTLLSLDEAMSRHNECKPEQQVSSWRWTCWSTYLQLQGDQHRRWRCWFKSSPHCLTSIPPWHPIWLHLCGRSKFVSIFHDSWNQNDFSQQQRDAMPVNSGTLHKLLLSIDLVSACAASLSSQMQAAYRVVNRSMSYMTLVLRSVSLTGVLPHCCKWLRSLFSIPILCWKRTTLVLRRKSWRSQQRAVQWPSGEM